MIEPEPSQSDEENLSDDSSADAPPDPLDYAEDELASLPTPAYESEEPEVENAPPDTSKPATPQVTTPSYRFEKDEIGDAAGLVGSFEHQAGDRDWSNELSSHKVIVELKKIETDVREILGERDPKRKRKLAGTRRWQELEDDILSWRYTDRFDETNLARLNELITRRHYLFGRLRFLAATRPTWNT